MTTARKPVPHHFTVDVEEYFQVLALEPYIPRDRWDVLPRRLDVGLRSLLDILSAHDTLATFFVLGWIADRAPELVRDISARGHEIASHGSDHRRVTMMTRDEFRESVRSAKASLENIIGRSVLGYRAPNFSIVRGCEWALEILVEEGYRYDSSLLPWRLNGSRYSAAQRDPHSLQLSAGMLYEVPPATLQIGPGVFLAGGGAYFRHLPYTFVHSALASAERRGVPGTFYIHPWELDTDQPRMQASFLARLRHYGGLARTVPRLKRLLSTFRFQPIATTLGMREAVASLS
jgi:polysaccharide deacetylase family protein (PEP-CTERM system associated)